MTHRAQKRKEKHACVFICNKKGHGVGATIEFRTVRENILVGTLVFHNEHDWQNCDTALLSKGDFSWDTLQDALILARRLYPHG